jgi:hypothetical protein
MFKTLGHIGKPGMAFFVYLYEMKTNTTALLDKARIFQLEIELCDKRITYLTSIAKVLINDDFDYVDMILVTRPKSGARPITMPLYPVASRTEMLEYYANDSPIPPVEKQIGFQRFFNPNELGNDSMMTVEIPLETKLAAAIIDQTLARLKQRKRQLLLDVNKIFRAQ